jgi:hypothetical protein
VLITDGAELFFDRLDSYAKLVELIDRGEAEGVHLECKAPREPRLSRDLEAKLGQAVSGFSNTDGGIILWGVSTTRHSHSGLDVLSQLEPIGNVHRLAQQVEATVPTLSTPPVTNSRTKVLVDADGSNRGVGITYIPKSGGDPIQANTDQRFYFRSGDDFIVLPYVLLQRLFAASEMPDLAPVLLPNMTRLAPDGAWRVPIALQNRSSAVGQNAKVIVVVGAPAECGVHAEGFMDVSNVNPNQRVFSKEFANVIHRGLNEIAGTMVCRPNPELVGECVVQLDVQLFANRMRARRWKCEVRRAIDEISVTQTAEEYLY